MHLVSDCHLRPRTTPNSCRQSLPLTTSTLAVASQAPEQQVQQFSDVCASTQLPAMGRGPVASAYASSRLIYTAQICLALERTQVCGERAMPGLRSKLMSSA